MLTIALFFADGRAFLLGAALIVIGAVLSLCTKRKRPPRVCVLFGVSLVVGSAVPVDVWCGAAWAACLVMWVAGEVRRGSTARHRRLAAAGVIATTFAAVGCELSFWSMPRVAVSAPARVAVIGDSLSAGMRRGESTWPHALSSDAGLEVIDLSQAGATAGSALAQAEKIPAGPAVVVLEIGGNDLLNGTPRRQFAEDLERLLERAGGPGRQLVMFELPLPPFRNGYGYTQRRLARRYGVRLIPKRVLSRAIGSAGGTLDGLHLSDAGHAIIADAVRAILVRN